MAGLNQSPQAGQTLAASQPLIYANFITFIEPGFAVDHVGFNQGVDSGKHTAIHMTAVTSPSFSATEIGLYNVLDGSSHPTLQVVKTIAGPTTVTSDITTLTTSGLAGSWAGNTQIASSLKYAWQQGTTNGSGLASFNFSGVFTTALYCIQATATFTSSPSQPVSCSTNITNPINPAIGTVYTFTGNAVAANKPYSILAIGV